MTSREHFIGAAAGLINENLRRFQTPLDGASCRLFVTVVTPTMRWPVRVAASRACTTAV